MRHLVTHTECSIRYLINDSQRENKEINAMKEVWVVFF